jgi:A/G-specific adenine glycosylase
MICPDNTGVNPMTEHTTITEQNAYTGRINHFFKEFAENGLSDSAIALFRSIIWSYYRTEGRDFPWRRTRNPYHIFVSEIMLQQTQVERVRKKYPIFIETFPDFAALASAPLEDVLRIWQGMGYNRRAKALKAGAERVMQEFNGSLPRDESILVTFPGIGKATAASIVAFAFNTPAVCIETNIRRVYIHFFFPRRDEVSDGEIQPLVEATLDRGNPREWYWALMDFGSMLKSHIPNPNIRSLGYRRQPPFQGSDRQLRGMILRHLIHEGPTPEDDLVRELSADPARISQLLRALMREEFIVIEGNMVRIS